MLQHLRKIEVGQKLVIRLVKYTRKYGVYFYYMLKFKFFVIRSSMFSAQLTTL